MIILFLHLICRGFHIFTIKVYHPLRLSELQPVQARRRLQFFHLGGSADVTICLEGGLLGFGVLDRLPILPPAFSDDVFISLAVVVVIVFAVEFVVEIVVGIGGKGLDLFFGFKLIRFFLAFVFFGDFFGRRVLALHSLRHCSFQAFL